MAPGRGTGRLSRGHAAAHCACRRSLQRFTLGRHSSAQGPGCAFLKRCRCVDVQETKYLRAALVRVAVHLGCTEQAVETRGAGGCLEYRSVYCFRNLASSGWSDLKREPFVTRLQGPAGVYTSAACGQNTINWLQSNMVGCAARAWASARPLLHPFVGSAAQRGHQHAWPAI